MAEAVGAVRIDLFANLAQWVSGLDKAEGRLDRFAKNAERTSKNIVKAGNKLSVGLSAPILAFAGLSIKAAADAQDLQGAFNIAFGDMADDATVWAEKTGNAMHRSTQTIQKTAMGFQALFEDVTPNAEAAAELSQRFTELTTDFAAFRNVTQDQAFDMLSGGLAGAGKALKRLGIDITDGALKLEAHRIGIAKNNVELTNSQKVMARASIIMNGLNKERGEAARSEGDAAEQIQNTREQFDELLVVVGEGLLPIFNDLLKGVRDLIAWFSGLNDETKAAIGYTAAFAAAVGPVVVVVGNAVKVVGFAGTALGKLGLAFVGAGKGAQTFVGQASGAVLRLAALATAAYALGAALGAALAPKADQEMVRAKIMVAGLQKIGLSAEEARQGVKQYYAELAKGHTMTEAEIISYGKFAAGFNTVAKEGAAVADSVNAVADANAALDPSIQAIIAGLGDMGGAGKDTADKFDALRSKIDPIGTSLKTYKEEVAQAVKLGYDLSTVQAALGKEFVSGLSSADGFRAALATLPPEIQKIVAAQDELAARTSGFDAALKAGIARRDEQANLAKDAEQAAQDSIQSIRDYGASLTDQFDPMAVYAKRMQGIHDAFALGAISADVYTKASAAAFAETPGGQMQVQLVDDLASAFTDAATGAGNLGDAIKQMIMDALKAQVIKPFFQNLFSGIFPQTQGVTQAPGGGGFDLGSIVQGAAKFFGFGGTRDKGGPVKAGMSYDIGSGVRETFTAPADGHISRGAGGGPTQNFYIEAKDPNAFRNSERQIKRSMKREQN